VNERDRRVSSAHLSEGRAKEGAVRTVIILGAAGRDFHDFNVVFRSDPRYRVLAFTAAQIPDIDGRRYPPELAEATRLHRSAVQRELQRIERFAVEATVRPMEATGRPI